MNPESFAKLPPLQQLLLQILQNSPQGYTEYELLKLLQSRKEGIFENIEYHNPTALFKVHFSLFHHLYQLQQTLWCDTAFHLDVSPLRICIHTTTNKPGKHLAEHNPLRDFYLESENLEKTGDDEIKHMLDRFWTLMRFHEKEQLALAELELQKPVSYAQIKKQYKKLSLRHHPDRGGEKEKFQQLYEAMKVLAKLHGKPFK